MTFDGYNQPKSRQIILKKLFALLAAPPEPPSPPAKAAAPYAQSAVNTIYELLFCDNPSLFQPKSETQLSGWLSVLFNSKPDAIAIRGLAGDETAESRVRMLAFNWLRKMQLPVPRNELLGAIVEVPLHNGLDVIASYSDGQVRYINHTGKLAVFEPAPLSVAEQSGKLLAASQLAIGHIGPWDRARLPPPAYGKVRMTFLVSDGLYFGEGPMDTMQRDPIGAPVIREAGKLIQSVVDEVLKGPLQAT
jgi:hypothetical protein